MFTNYEWAGLVWVVCRFGGARLCFNHLCLFVKIRVIRGVCRFFDAQYLRPAQDDQRVRNVMWHATQLDMTFCSAA